jgi:hypothetical protein
VLDVGCAIRTATGDVPFDVIAPAILLHHDRVIEALRAGRPVPGRLSECGEIIDSAGTRSRVEGDRRTELRQAASAV